MAERTATAEWKGTLKEGEGSFALGSGTISGAYSFDTRFGEKSGANPEELLGASLASCYAMALNVTLERKGIAAKSVAVEAKVFLGKDDSGFKVNRIDLETKVQAEGIEQEEFAEIAEQVKSECPISRALAATPITLKAELT